MIDLTKIDDETLIARGKYSTIRAAHEDSKKQLSVLCGELSATASKVLHQMQPSNDEMPVPVAGLIAAGRATLDEMDVCTQRILGLAQQKQDVKPLAWGRKP